MPNSFTVVPNIIPGNVTIGGTLTVGGEELRVGAGIPFVRIGRDTSSRGGISWNYDMQTGAKDSGPTSAAFLNVAVDPVNPSYLRINPANTSRTEALSTGIFTDYVAHNHTGTTTEDTIYTKTIPANTMGANGALRGFLRWSSSSQGATNTTIRIKLGTSVVLITFATVDSFFVDFLFANQNAANANVNHFTRVALSTGTVTGGGGATSQDTSVDTTFSITVTNGTSTDAQQFQAMGVQQFNSFGPV